MTKRICSTDGCSRNIFCRGMCAMHYQRARRSRPVSVECAHCGRAFEVKPDRSGPVPNYCSQECSYRAYRLRTRDGVNAARRAENAAKRAAITKACKECGAKFSPERVVRQVFCSKRCGANFSRDASGRACSEDGCDRPERAKGVCNMHYKRILRAEGRIKGGNWTPKRRAAWKARYALTRGAPDAEKFDYREIYERDGWVCGICSEPVDPDLAWPDPMSVSLDHVIPVSRGGRHSRDNAQCSHLTCNVRKLDRVDVA